jgi:hypothetical protein
MNNVSDTKPWHQQFWPWFLIALPATVVVACFYTVYLALTNPLSIVKEDYYKEGLAINQNQQRYMKAAELGLSAKCFLKDQQLQCEFITGLESLDSHPVQLQFMHPVNSDKDVRVFLSHISSSVYASDFLASEPLENFLQESRWYIYLEAMEGEWALQTESAVREQDALIFQPAG